MENRHFQVPSLATYVAAKPSMGYSHLGSHDGKLDWLMHDEELNKLRKSASFGFRSGSIPSPRAATRKSAAKVNEPDVSWVNSLVKEAPAQPESGPISAEDHQQLQCHLNNGTDVIPAWLEQMYIEQEQMVA
ncbi:hypothetical protein PIB30_065829 [Stylosanthes scabra]|uniref:Uncharacterized protein n=1 Tax=Stylosanthes scabra TaxID=79078 RepID=A0ABU6ZKY0_9FABA|nr:hypothetical protein [Stylosanthes scabra]